MPSSPGVLSTAESRRAIVAEAALRAFARGGYYSTTVADIARESGISPAYVFKLFPGKEALFVAALEACFTKVRDALAAGAVAASDQSPLGILDAMGNAYAELIRDRTLLKLQVHAQSAADVVEIGNALRKGLADVTTYAKRRSGASDDDVQRFIAFGQLCHLLVAAQVDESMDEWGTILAHGVLHPA